MSPNLPENNFLQHDESREWKKFLIQLRGKALPHIKKHFHETEDQEDVLADLLFTFISKLLKNRGAKALTDICPTPDEQRQFLAHIKDRVIDIDRRINGRQRPPSNIKQKSEIEQEVYKKFFMQKLTTDQIIYELCNDGKIEAKELLHIIEHLESELGERARKLSHGSYREKEILVRSDAELPDFNTVESQPDQSVMDKEQNTLLKNALAQLDVKDQLILQYRYVDGKEISAIAKILKCPRYQINYRKKRGEKKLKKYFKKCGLTIDDFI